MQFRYPYEVQRDGKSMLVTFPDVPGALTQVDPGEPFDASVQDCLVAALGGYVEQRLPIPRASSTRGRPYVALDALLSAKLGLAAAMADSGISNCDLARRLGVTEKVVRRLLDLDHGSRIERLESALGVLGRRLELAVLPSSGREGAAGAGPA